MYFGFYVSPYSAVEDPDQDSLPAVTSLAAAAPNPFNPRTEISFKLAGPGRARLDIFDVKGQLVRTLVNAYLEAGSHQEIWNGRDSGGLEVGSGVYLYRLNTTAGMLEGKMLLVR